MRKVLFALTALAALALLAPNAVVAQAANNQIGIYTTATPDLADLEDTAHGDIAGGSFSLYVVVTNPYNDNTSSAINNLGGFEFRIEWPGAWFVTPVLAGSATNFVTPPDFLCGSLEPVVNNMVTVVTLTCGSFGADPEMLFISPISDTTKQTIPGAIALTDGDDNFTISQMYPASGDFATHVFGYNMSVVPNEDVSFGGVKALFQ